MKNAAILVGAPIKIPEALTLYRGGHKPRSAWSDVCTLASAAFLLVVTPQSKAPSHSITIALTDLTTTPNQTTSTPWHSVNIEQAEAQGILRSLNAITDPALQRIVGSYTDTDYFINGLANGEKNRLWVVTVAAGVQDVWNDPQHRAMLTPHFDSAEDCLRTFIAIISVESDSGIKLGNSLNGRVYGLAHAEDSTWLRAAVKYGTADDFGLTEEAWGQMKYALIGEKSFAQAEIDKADFKNAANTPAGQTVIKARSYGRAFMHIAGPLMAEALDMTVRRARLPANYFRDHKAERYVVWGLGYPQAPDLYRMPNGARVADQGGVWGGVARDNESVYHHAKGTSLTKEEVIGIYTARVLNLGPNRLYCRTNGWTINAVRPDTLWCRKAGFSGFRPMVTRQP